MSGGDDLGDGAGEIESGCRGSAGRGRREGEDEREKKRQEEKEDWREGLQGNCRTSSPHSHDVSAGCSKESLLGLGLVSWSSDPARWMSQLEIKPLSHLTAANSPSVDSLLERSLLESELLGGAEGGESKVKVVGCLSKETD